MAKTYSLVIVFNEDSDEIEYIEEEITEDTPDVLYKLSIDPDYYDDETLKQLMINGFIVGET